MAEHRTQQWKYETDNNFLDTFAHSPGEDGNGLNAGPHVVAPGMRNQRQVLSYQDEECPLVPAGGSDWLV